MRSRTLTLSAVIMAMALLGWPSLSGAAEQARQRGGGGQRTGTAVSRGGSHATPAPRGGSVVRAPAPSGGRATAPRGNAIGVAQGRERGNRPATGQAVPRDGRGYYPGGRVYIPNYYYPYGAFGLGYFYYDPYWWGPYGYGYGYGYPYGYGYGYPSMRYYRGEAYGSVRLKVTPREAEVYVDGYYVGQVDDFDGIFQHLELEPGAHRVEIRAVGFEPLVVEIRAEPGRTITYRGDLQPVPVK